MYPEYTIKQGSMMWPSPKDPSRCSQSVNKQVGMSLALAGYISQNEAKPSENLVFSPVSINLLVSLIAAGASGETHQELLSFLNFDSIDHVNSLSKELVSFVLADGTLCGGPKLSLANSVWVKQNLPLKPPFQHLVEMTYHANAFQIDFVNTPREEIISQVNQWAEEQTNGLVKQAIPPDTPIDRATALILANALYFKGEWDQKFDPSLTKEDDFHLLCGDSVKVPFMRTNKKQYISVFDGFKVLRLPYQQGSESCQFSMYIFLPDSNHGLPGLVDKVGSKADFLGRHIPREKVQ